MGCAALHTRCLTLCTFCCHTCMMSISIFFVGRLPFIRTKYRSQTTRTEMEMVGCRETAQAHETDRCRAPDHHSLSHARSPFRIHTLFWHATSNHFLVPDAVIHTPHMHTPHILIMLSLPGGHCQMTGFHRCIARLRLPRDLLRTFSCSQWCWRCMKQKCRR
jgi:hypothetical protein